MAQQITGAGAGQPGRAQAGPRPADQGAGRAPEAREGPRRHHRRHGARSPGSSPTCSAPAAGSTPTSRTSPCRSAPRERASDGPPPWLRPAAAARHRPGLPGRRRARRRRPRRRRLRLLAARRAGPRHRGVPARRRAVPGLRRAHPRRRGRPGHRGHAQGRHGPGRVRVRQEVRRPRGRQGGRRRPLAGQRPLRPALPGIHRAARSWPTGRGSAGTAPRSRSSSTASRRAWTTCSWPSDPRAPTRTAPSRACWTPAPPTSTARARTCTT